MKTYSFENMLAWKEARILVKLVYTITKSFPKEEIYGLTSQIRRAAVSIASNLSEGSARITDADQKNFYKTAYSSAMESLNQAIISNDLEYLTDDQLVEFRLQLDKTTYLINQLRKGL